MDEVGSPRIKSCQKAYRKRRSTREPADENGQGSSTSTEKHKRLSNLDVSDFIVKYKIKSETALLAVANEQRQEGKKDLANYVLSRNTKSLNDVMRQTWKMKEVSSDLKRQQASRMELIRKAADAECLQDCDGAWLKCAQEVLISNKVHPILFAAAMRDVLQFGRGKHRNIIIVGPTNCGKTFLLELLELVFNTFSNPAADKYAWVGADKAEVILLNDFRWSKELIEWKSLLLLLEGDQVNLPAPKNHFVTDVCINGDTPVFATSKSVITCRGAYNSQDQSEDDMMTSRWKVFHFSHSIPESEQKNVSPCSKCFAQLVLMGKIN